VEEAQAALERGRRADWLQSGTHQSSYHIKQTTTYVSSWPKRALVRQAQLGEVGEVLVLVLVLVQLQVGLAVDGVSAQFSWGLSSNPVWLGQRELEHLMAPVPVPVVEVLLPLEEAGAGTVRVSFRGMWQH
jgi:hypothetical protein